MGKTVSVVEPSPVERVGMRLRRRRLELGLTREEVVASAGGVFSSRNLHFWEHGVHLIPLDSAEKLCPVYGDMASLMDPCQREDDPTLDEVVALQRHVQAERRRGNDV